MDQKAGFSLICDDGFFYDTSVQNCLSCDNICGKTGYNEVECRTKCPDYKQSFSTQAFPSTLSTNEDLMKTNHDFPVQQSVGLGHGFLMILAPLSVFFAISTIVLMACFIWKRKKAAREAVSESFEQRQLMGNNNLEDGNSPYNTERRQSPELLTQYTSHSNNFITMTLSEKERLPRVSTSPSYLMNLNEEEPKVNSRMPDIRRVSSCLSAISLRSDGSVASLAAEQRNSFPENFQPAWSQSSDVSSAISNTLKMFGWLNKTDWVKEYSGGVNCVYIGVEGIGKSIAEDTIRRKGRNLPNFHFIVKTEPTPGRYVPCPLGSEAAGSGTPTDSNYLRPGLVIYSPQMEPDLETRVSSPGYAIYSGSIHGMNVKHGNSMENGNLGMGITVGHLFSQVGIKASIGPDTPQVGSCFCKHEFVEHRLLSRITADLALVRVQLQTNNAVEISGVRYKLRLFKGDLDSMSPVEVIIQHRNRTFNDGIIADSMFTYKNSQLFNTLRIVKSTDNPKRITDEGDSGSLVLSKPLSMEGNNDPVLYVYGMVIGYWVSDDLSRSHTVATRLWNILETIGGTSDVDFSCGTDYCTNFSDSGYASYIP